MRLLMTTQRLDLNHPVLGFSHIWASKLAERVDKLYVLTLYLGEHHLPPNAQAFSLGKEHGASRPQRFLNFHRAVAPLALRHNIDGIFVQQTEINAILASPYAKILGLPMVLFKAHGRSLRMTLRIANLLIDRALTSTPVAYPIDTPKKVITGQGIDVDLFSPGPKSVDEPIKTLVAVSRVSPIKNYELQIEALDILVNQRGRRDVTLRIYGSLDWPEYAATLKTMVAQRHLEEVITFEGPADFGKVADVYRSAYAMIHTSNTDSLDKVVLEAMACGTLPVTTMQVYRHEFQQYADRLVSQTQDPVELADKIEAVLDMPRAEYSAVGTGLRELVVRNHSIDRFADQVVDILERLRKQ